MEKTKKIGFWEYVTSPLDFDICSTRVEHYKTFLGKRDCKGQIDAIGLAVIVIIIAMAVIFTLPFLTSSKDIQSLNEQYTSLKADSTIAVLLSTTIENCTSNIKQELSSCLTQNKPICLSDCSEVTKLTTQLIELSLPKNSYYSLSTQPETEISVSKGTCQNKITSSRHFINQETSILFVICA